jgi:predicted dehydrogenase
VIPVGYVDPRPDALERAGAAASAAPTFSSPSVALAAVAADIALVVTPPDSRVPLVSALLERGLHVLVEKPLALTLADALTMVRAAERAGRQLGLVQNFRYLPVTRATRELVLGRRHGAPTFATVLYIRNRDGWAPHLNKYPLVMEHPMLLEQSIHHLDLFRFVYACEPQDVTCTTWNPPGSPYRGDACVAALIRMRDGPVVVYEGTWVSGSDTIEFQWRTDCEQGVIVQRSLFGDLSEGERAEADLRPVPLAPAEPFITDSVALLEEFVLACRAGQRFGSDGRDHLRTLALTMACAESAASARRVSVPDFARQHGLDIFA